MSAPRKNASKQDQGSRLPRILENERVREIVMQISAIVDDQVAVLGPGGKPLLGENGRGKSEHAIMAGGDKAGAVRGGMSALPVANLLGLVSELERDRRSLGQETLQRYNELTLLYEMARELSQCVSAGSAAKVLLSGALQNMGADLAVVALLDQGQGPRMLAVEGDEAQARRELAAGESLWREAMRSSRSRILENAKRGTVRGKAASLICAPLQASGAALGVCVLWSMKPGLYQAQQAKFLEAASCQAASAIACARLQEKLLAVVEAATDASALMLRMMPGSQSHNQDENEARA